MFSLFRKSRGASPETLFQNAMLPRRMDLEERKAFRRELVDQTIRESLQALNVAEGSYRLRIMPLDLRHHRFVAMLDVGRHFQPQRAGRAWDDPETESWIRKRAYERFGLMIEAIYWRSGAALGTSRSGAVATGPTHPHYQLVSEEEKQALMAAIQQGGALPVLHVGDWEYQTDMAPLEESGSRH